MKATQSILGLGLKGCRLVAMGALMLGLAGVPATMAGGGKIIAVYGDGVSRTPVPEGWHFLWNASGQAGDSKGYAPLVPVEVSAGRRKTLNHGVTNETGAVRQDRPSFGQYGNAAASRDERGVARCAIASYTLQADAKGNVWVNHGNVLNTTFEGTVLSLYLNDDLKFTASVKKDRVPTLFQHNLGRLKKGDAIRVVVGPGEGAAQAAVRLRYVVEEWPSGETPGAPVNILAPPIEAAEPQRDSDGGFATYLAKHRAQCDAALSNRSELVFIGDSITARWPAEMLQAKYGQYRPANLGIGGDWIQNVMWRLLNGVLDKLPVKVAVLLIGTNNLSNRFTPEEVAGGIGRLIKTIREKAPESRILLLGILPRGPSLEENQANRRIRETNERLAKLADGTRVVFLDIGDALVDPDGRIAPEVMPDQLHVAMPGFVRWMDAMSPVLDRMLEGR